MNAGSVLPCLVGINKAVQQFGMQALHCSNEPHKISLSGWCLGLSNAGSGAGHTEEAFVGAHLGRDCVGLADLVTPVATPDGHHRHLGLDDGAADGSRHLSP